MPRKILNKFSVSHMQILDENGKVDKKLEPKIPEKDLLHLYRSMTAAREFDNRMLKLQRQGRIGTFGPSVGQEAAHCTPVLLMDKEDWFVGAFRESGGRFMRGETMEQTLHFYNGYEEGNTKADSNTLPISIVVGSQMLHAVGIGYTLNYKGIKDRAVVTFFGDGATSEGDFHEAMNFASVWNTPVVFICQNNHWAISLPRHKQTKSKTIAQKAIAYDMPSIQVDGNDILAMYVAVKEAMVRAKKGDGPTLIEAVTYRLIMHTTADDPSKYRTEEEVAPWHKRDPLKRTKLYLIGKGIWTEKKDKAMMDSIKDEIDATVKSFESTVPFRQDKVFDHVFGDPHYTFKEQHQEFLTELEKEKNDGEA